MHAEFRLESWPLRQPFRISRDTAEELRVLYCVLNRGGHVGRAEAAGVDYHGETPDSLKRFLEDLAAAGRISWDRMVLQEQMPAGGARNAIDCALWDLEARDKGRRVRVLADVEAPCDLQPPMRIWSWTSTKPGRRLS